jgi:hypothetical protein
MPDEDINLEQLTPEDKVAILALAEQIGTGFPQQEEKASMFSFFKRILEAKDSAKVANVSEPELYAERILRNTALFCETLKYDKVAKYLGTKAENIAATSLGKNMEFIKAAVTQRKFIGTSEAETKELIGMEAKSKWWQRKKK